MYFSSFFFFFFFIVYSKCVQMSIHNNCSAYSIFRWNFCFRLFFCCCSFFIYIRSSEFSILHMIVIYGICIWLSLVFFHHDWFEATKQQTLFDEQWTAGWKRFFLKKKNEKKWKFLVNLKMCRVHIMFSVWKKSLNCSMNRKCKTLQIITFIESSWILATTTMCSNWNDGKKFNLI